MMKFMFDCDDTLYDCQWPFKMAVKEILPELYCDDLSDFYHLYRKKGDEMFDQVQDGTLDPFTAGILRIENTLKAMNLSISKSQAENFQKVYKEYQYKIHMDLALKNYLMKENYEYAILTNGENQHQRNKCHSLSVCDFVDEKNIFTSSQIGFAKPDIRAFQFVLDQMNEKYEDWYYIGDNYVNDMEGAKKAGMKTIHFNRHKNIEGPCSDFVVYNEYELIQLMEDLKHFNL
ncbi:HAD family hydrolase [Floccifex sp.]|uniref:HAD family hydrolase n=1 Tax=Floccifex sp. TaxID=2815810 RepID=UPI002A75CC24|nr:HAD family hydrolase [Floccifex sp.]MDY2957734.1 HAD family hydrolase [Floccifex sp.]